MKLLMTVLGLLTITSTAMGDIVISSKSCALFVSSVESADHTTNSVYLRQESSSAGAQSFGAQSSDGKIYARVRILKGKDERAVLYLYKGEKKRAQSMGVPGHGEINQLIDGKNYLLTCDLTN